MAYKSRVIVISQSPLVYRHWSLFRLWHQQGLIGIRNVTTYAKDFHRLVLLIKYGLHFPLGNYNTSRTILFAQSSRKKPAGILKKHVIPTSSQIGNTNLFDPCSPICKFLNNKLVISNKSDQTEIGEDGQYKVVYLGMGVFSANAPNPVMMAVGTMMGHLVYGLVFGLSTRGK
ncbi:hypothetical protein NAF17_08015 [Mucilaginibacter sp. RB4R14]|uniref:hypothetical protein n=1 Tax=Mucilaginibacter aurantiaciroseus TaxID=2949308 RepID=UPI002091BF71|nr:hypothetical protein [Mucilaginibacter aurantiaciroseus]MCO5935483.1 hypothetical protein [Mucilaginibacter aurantiaciroseus]